MRMAQAAREDGRRGSREEREGRGREVREGERRGRTTHMKEVAQQARTQALVWASTLAWSTILCVVSNGYWAPWIVH